ncbi:MAG: nucleotide sugar dehydrogenase [Candidatus Firestonebacteria bacterium]
MNNYIRNGLRDGKFALGIWGLGYIGCSTCAYFAKQRIHSLGTDISIQRVIDINDGKEPIPNLERWLGFRIKPLVKRGFISAVTDWQKLIHPFIPVHFIAVQTEKNDKPYNKYIIDVISKLSNFKKIKMKYPPLVIIESTLTPNQVDNMIIPLFNKRGLKVGKDILLGVAPRRDWLGSTGKSLVNIPRVIGATTNRAAELMYSVLSLVCKHLVMARNHRDAEIVKSVENAYRLLNISLANQLTLAYPDVDIAEILKLVGTKWNIETYYPSFGAGGYCIPIAPLYVLKGAKHPERLSLLKQSLLINLEQPIKVARSIIKRGAKNVGVLGICYKGDIPIWNLSPAVSIIKILQKKKIEVKVYDPYFSCSDFVKIGISFDIETFKFPDGLVEFDTLLIISDHSQFKLKNIRKIKKYLKKCRLILDNTGIWSNFNFGKNIEYFRAGNKNWIK